ncbi:substrate-binding domain-containing protein [Pigmentiphaga soli]
MTTGTATGVAADTTTAAGEAPTRRRATVKDVAREAGVSIGTVSRVIRQESSVTADIREKVEAAILRLGWQPSMAAQSMRGVRSRTIGFIFADIRNPLYAEMVKGAEDLLSEHGYMLIVASSDGRPEREQALIDRFSRWNVEGLLFSIEDESHPQVARALARVDFPKVMIERAHDNADARVCADHYRGTLHAAEYLLDLGHRRIGLISGGRRTWVGRSRLQAYRDAHASRGVPIDQRLLRLDSFSQSYGFRETQLLLGLDEPPSAILALGMRLLAGVLPAVRSRRCVIPRDLSLVVSNDSELAQLATPAISAIRYDPYALGREAAQLLMKNLGHGERLSGTRLEIPTEFVMRESCARIAPNPPAARPDEQQGGR